MEEFPPSDISRAIDRNIQVLERLRKQEEDRRSVSQRIADSVTAFSGSMVFLYVHAIWFLIWIVVNMKWLPGVPAFDPYPFGLLTMIVSLEAIFLSTLVLISQNRQSEQDAKSRAMDLQIDLLAEYEVTQSLRLLRKIAQKLEIDEGNESHDLDELCQAVGPDILAREVDSHGRTSN